MVCCFAVQLCAKFFDLQHFYQEFRELKQALADIGYKGTATLELSSGDLAYLKETSRRFDLILTGA